MTRRLWLLVAVFAVVHVAIALGSFGLMRLAERSGRPIFRNLDRVLVFADVPLYFTHASRTVAGQIPYRDDPIEYPVLALPFLYAPRLFTSSQTGFVLLFAAEMFLFNAVLIALVAMHVAKEQGPAKVLSSLIWLTAFYTCVAPWVMGRYDIVPAVMGFGAACMWFGGRPGCGGFLAAVGTLTKLVPGVIAPIGFVASLMGTVRPRWRGVIAFSVTLFAGIALWLAIGGQGVFDSFRYHSERGIEIGSVASGRMWVDAYRRGESVSVVHDHGSLNLVTSRTAPASNYALVAQGLVLFLVTAAFLFNRGRAPIHFAGAAILAFIIGGKVLSPQYLIWVMPFIATVNGLKGNYARPVFLGACVLTLVLYPWATTALRNVETWAFLTLNVRNALLCITWFCLILPSPEANRSKTIPASYDVL